MSQRNNEEGSDVNYVTTGVLMPGVGCRDECLASFLPVRFQHGSRRLPLAVLALLDPFG